MKGKVWSGKGLPPIGTVCEYLKLAKYKTNWVKVRVVFIGENLIVLEHGASGNEFSEQLADVTFRPIKTPEQISAEERSEAIHEMLALVDIYSSLIHMLGVLYDAGYRKTEASDSLGLDWPDESRIDVIGQNGNDGEVYLGTQKMSQSSSSKSLTKKHLY